MSRIPQASLPVLLRERAESDPDAVLMEEVDGRSITVGDFHAASIKVADALVSLGVAKGDCIATVLDPSIRTQSVWIGICWAGAMEVPVNPDFKGNSLVYAIGDCKARVVITEAAYLSRIAEVFDKLPDVAMILTIDAADPTVGVPYRELAEVEANAPSVQPMDPQLTDPYAVIYTSGTTGASKGVVTPWGSLQHANSNQLFKGDDWSAYDDPTFYSPWPSFHSSGRTGLTFAGERSGRVVIRKRLSTSAFWDDIRRYRCTHAHLLGIAGWMMAQPAKANDADNPLSRVLMNPVIENVAEFEKRFGVTVTTGWGMTEIGFPMASGKIQDYRSCGKLSEDYDVRIVDEDGNDVPEGESGELIIRPHFRWLLFTEYLGKPEATAKSWRDDWYCTGDVLRRDAEGNYFFVDRKSDYMRVAGNNVSSIELEGEARLHPQVAEIAAVAVSSAELAQAGLEQPAGEDDIRVFVQREPGATISEEELVEHLAANLPRYMLPRLVEFVDSFPRTPTGKIQKKELRARPISPGCWDRKAHSPRDRTTA